MIAFGLMVKGSGFDAPGGNAAIDGPGRQISGGHGTKSEDSSVTYGNAGLDGGASADPRVVSESNRR